MITIPIANAPADASAPSEPGVVAALEAPTADRAQEGLPLPSTAPLSVAAAEDARPSPTPAVWVRKTGPLEGPYREATAEDRAAADADHRGADASAHTPAAQDESVQPVVASVVASSPESVPTAPPEADATAVQDNVQDASAATPADPPLAAVAPGTEAAPEPINDSPVATASAAQPIDPSEREAQVRQALQAWLTAWNSHDASAFVAHYASDFQPEAGTSHADWRQWVTDNLQAPRPKVLQLSGVTFDQADNGEASDAVTVRFRESSVAGVLRVTRLKRLDFMRQDEQWRIVAEGSGQ